MMGRKGVISVLVLIAGLLLSDHGAKGQESTPAPTAETTVPTIAETTVPISIVPSTVPVPLEFELTTTAGAQVNLHSCPSYTENREAICNSVPGTADIPALLNSGDFTSVCSHSMLQYACAPLQGLSAVTYATIIKCFLADTMTVTSQESFSLLISQISVETLMSTFDILNNQVPSASIPENNKKYFLNAALGKLFEAPEKLTPGFVTVCFTERLLIYLGSISKEVLDCINALAMSCDNFESIVGALDISYSKFSLSQQEQIGSWITDFISTHSCSKPNAADSIRAYYGHFVNNVDITALFASWSVAQLGSAIEAFTDFQLAQYVGFFKSFSSYETALPILQLLETKDYTFIFNFLSNLPSGEYGQEISYTLLYTAVSKLSTSDDPLCRPKLKTIFQAKFSYLYTAVNSSIFDLIVLGDCSDYQDVYGAIDLVYSSFSKDTQGLLYEYRKSYLNAEALKSGSACTYGLSSLQWFQVNLGMSSGSFSYDDIMGMNSNFKGYEVAEYLSVNQTLDLIMASGLFSSESPEDFEKHITAIITVLKSRGYVYLQLFLMELKGYLIRFNIQFIVNFNVRRLFLQGVWGILEERFALFSANDWFVWYHDYLSFTLSAITTDQLSVLSNGVVKDCSNLGSIVGGFDGTFEQMGDETKSAVANWIVNILRNDASKCLEVEGNWLTVTFKQFKPFVSISEIKELNPDFNTLDSLAEFTPTQIGQVVFSETSALSNVSVIEYVFGFLVVENNNVQTVDNMGAFWDSFNAEMDKIDQFTSEVKYTMLELTTEELSIQYLEFTEEQWTLWWDERLHHVTTEVTSTILGEIPLNISCGSYKAIAHGLSRNYEDTNEASQDNVYAFMVSFFTKGTKCSDSEVSTVSFIKTSLGNYCEKATYEELTTYYSGFNVFEEGVFALLSEVQIGDLIVVENVYDSEDLAVKVFTYLQTLTIEQVDSCMAQFTATAIKKNIKIVNFSVGQYMLQSYLTIIKTSLVTYSHTQIVQIFQFRISILLPFFSKTILQLFVVEDCDTLVVFVAQLDKGFSSMTVETQKEVASWIMDLLKSSILNGCGSISQTTSVWVDSVMKSYFAVVPLSEIQAVYSSVDITQVINSTSVTQKVEYIFSSEEILTNVESVTTVLESMYAGDNIVTVTEIYSFCSGFNLKYEALTVKYMSNEVQETIFTFLFTSWISNLNSMTVEEISQFEEYFQFFLSGVSVTAIEEFPVTMDCSVYKVIISAFSNVMDVLSEEIKKSIFDTIIKYLDAQSTGSSDACGGLYTDSRTYVTNIYYGFFEYASFYQMSAYYKEFNAYKVLDLCNGAQLGNLFMNSTAIRNQFEAIQIFVEIEKREYSEVSSFLVESTRVAEEKEIVSLPNANIESLLYTAVWGPVSEHLKSEADFQWFAKYATLIIPSIPATAIETIQVPDCNSQSSMVSAFSSVFDKQTEDQRDSVYGKIKEFNKGQKDRAGAACKTESGKSSEWVSLFYAKYSGKALYEEFKEFKSDFSAADSLNVLSGAQCADYAIESGALRSEEAINNLFESIDSTQKVEEFLMQFNEKDPTELRNSPFGNVMMSKTMKITSPNFSSFTPVDWTYWFQDVLKNILHVISVSDLELIPFLTCDSYHSILKGLNNVYDDMSEDTRKNVYNSCIKTQLNKASIQNGVRCGQDIVRNQDWIDVNVGEFYKYADIKDYEFWNANFKSTDIVDTASPEQLGVIAVDTIEKEEVACQVAGRVQQFGVEEAGAFLDSFSTAFKTSNAKIASRQIGFKFLSASVTALKSSFVHYSSSEWENLWSVRLKPFIFSINAEVLTSILDSADCTAYFVGVKYLDSSFDDFSADTQGQLAAVLTDFLKKQASGSCSMSGDSSAVASALFGKFGNFVSYESFSSYIQGFDGLSAISLLSPSQQGSLAFSGDILNDESKATILVNSIQAMSFEQLDAFLTSFQATAEEKSLSAISNVQVRDLLFDAVYGIFSKQFVSLSSAQWANYFIVKFGFLLPSITEAHIAMIPKGISCSAFQSVISGCNQQYSKLSGSAQKAIADKAKSYLSFNKPDFGPKCPPSSGGSGAWLGLNLASFGDYFLTDDILAVYPGFIFTDAVAYLTAEQCGSLASTMEFLSDKDKISKILNGITSVTLGEFMDSFNAGLVKNGITQISNVQVKKFFLGEVFCKLGSILSSFTASDYSQWFGGKLKFFISSIDAKSFGFVSSSISCDSLAAIVEPLSVVENPENPEAIFDFINSVLEAQKASSGVACTSSALSSGQWYTKYFSKYGYLTSWEHITVLFPTIVLSEVKSYLTTVQLASASSTVISNTAEITKLLYSFEGTMEDFLVYMGTLRDIMSKNPDMSSNSKVKEILLMMVGNLVFQNFGDLSLQEAQSWMDSLDFLLPSVNSTIMEQFPKNMSCEHFQVVVGDFSKQYYYISSTRKQNIADFITAFLLKKLATDNDSCTSGLSTIDYIQKNCGLFCNQITDENVKAFNPAIDPVSFVQVCKLS